MRMSMGQDPDSGAGRSAGAGGGSIPREEGRQSGGYSACPAYPLPCGAILEGRRYIGVKDISTGAAADYKN